MRMSKEEVVDNEPVFSYVYSNRNGVTAAEVSSHSVKCLQPSKYLNDEVIQFYTAYLINHLCPVEQVKKIHVFDNIFHKLLTDTFGDKLIDVNKWKCLDKWFGGIDIFEKDFLIFPVCQEEHWLAIIVCYPSEVREFDEKAPSPDSTDSRHRPVPGIIVLDSLGLNNRSITRYVRDFLDYEWRTRATVVKDFHHHNLEQYHPKLLKQTNSFDCGIFMLAYLKAFIKNSEKFYRHVRRNKETTSDTLNEMINDALVDCSRESMRNLITRTCEVKNYNADKNKD